MSGPFDPQVGLQCPVREAVPHVVSVVHGPFGEAEDGALRQEVHGHRAVGQRGAQTEIHPLAPLTVALGQRELGRSTRRMTRQGDQADSVPVAGPVGQSGEVAQSTLPVADAGGQRVEHQPLGREPVDLGSEIERLFRSGMGRQLRLAEAHLAGAQETVQEVVAGRAELHSKRRQQAAQRVGVDVADLDLVLDLGRRAVEAGHQRVDPDRRPEGQSQVARGGLGHHPVGRGLGRENRAGDAVRESAVTDLQRVEFHPGRIRTRVGGRGLQGDPSGGRCGSGGEPEPLQIEAKEKTGDGCFLPLGGQQAVQRQVGSESFVVTRQPTDEPALGQFGRQSDCPIVETLVFGLCDPQVDLSGGGRRIGVESLAFGPSRQGDVAQRIGRQEPEKSQAVDL